MKKLKSKKERTVIQMTEYISKQAAVDSGYLSDWYISSVGDEPPVWTDAHIDELLNDFIVIPKDTKAIDVQPVVDTVNMATASDEFICIKCGIYLKDYIKVVMDEDNDGYIDEQHYEYEPKFCPECGAKVKDGNVK